MSAELQALLDAVALRQPLVHRLAVFASLAVRIEPPLLRRLRLQLMADAEPGIEADLWFSPLVESFDSDACVLYPWVAGRLQTALKDSGRLADVWSNMAEAHADAPHAQRIEEQVAYLSLLGDATGAASALRGALKAMLASPERGVAVARWAMHALPRLPAQLAGEPEVRALEQGMHSRIAVIGAASAWRESPWFDLARDGWVLPAATPSLPAVHIGLRLDGLALRVADAAEVAEAARLAIPDTRARRLQVRATDAAGRVRYAALRGRPGERVVFDAVPFDIEITTEAGEVLGLEPMSEAPVEMVAELADDPPKAAPAYQCAMYISSAARDREWVSGLREVIDLQLRQLMGADALPSFLAEMDVRSDGEWTAQMEAVIAWSFAFVLVVSDASLESEWSRREFEMFARHAGPDGVRERVYVVAMSQTAIQRWQGDRFWSESSAHDRLWMPFFDKHRPEQPLERSTEFYEQSHRLARDLAERLQAASQPAPQPKVSKPAAPVEEPDALRIVIEDDVVNPQQWRLLDESLRRRWEVLQHESTPARAPLGLRSLRIRLDRAAETAPLADADAMVFVWTDQTFEAMQARVEQAERLLPDAVPGLAVCLSPPHPLDRWPPPLVGCTTLRFDATDPRSLTVAADDADRLDRFLLAAMAHRQRAAAGSTPA